MYSPFSRPYFVIESRVCKDFLTLTHRIQRCNELLKILNISVTSVRSKYIPNMQLHS